MEQVKKNMEEIRGTIRKYGEMPICPERAAFLANCWAAYCALCMISNEEDLDMEDYKGAAHDGHGEKSLTKDQVMRWVASMENADGTHGAHWTMEQTEQARKQKTIDCDPVMFYAAMNMMYSDYCKAAEKTNCSSADLFACMAKAFLDDKDAKPHKLALYYHHIAEK